ncbi:MAG: hypothetical protein HY268_31350, partial [Deltaproteobacteria bacterium]|nr:hypothetical protein [Deltaproteobacteria bacterium]
MKLIFCQECQDVIKLLSSERSCSCANSGGRYLEDLITVEIWGAAVPIMIENDNFLGARRRTREGAEPAERRFEASIFSE